MRVLFVAIIFSMFAASYGLANDDLNSELAHVAGSAVIAGTSTAIADHYALEHRALIGFSVAAAVGVVGEMVNTDFSWLDMTSDLIGAGIGAFVTDKYLLVPVLSTRQNSGRVDNRVGLVLYRRF